MSLKTLETVTHNGAHEMKHETKKEPLNVVVGRVLTKMLEAKNGEMSDADEFIDSQTGRTFTFHVSEVDPRSGIVLSPAEHVAYLYTLVERGDIDGIMRLLDMPEKNELTSPACSHHRGIIYACRVWKYGNKSVYLKHLKTYFGELLGRRMTTEGYDKELLTKWEPNRELDGPPSQFHFIRLPYKDQIKPMTERDKALINAVQFGSDDVSVGDKRYKVSVEEVQE